MIVFHHNDADGRCAAAIVKRWYHRYPELAIYILRLVELDYKDRVPVDQICEGETVVIVDFSFKPEVMAAVLAMTNRIIWCDHHVTAKDYNYGQHIDGLRDFSEKGLAGCELTWKHFFPDKPMPQGVELLGDYDAWRLRKGDRTFEFYEGLKLYQTDPGAPLWGMILDDHPKAIIEKLCACGRTAIRYRDGYCREIREAFGYETELDGHRAYAMNTYRFGSKGHGEKFTQYPVCIAYVHDGNQFTVSLYSDTVDVGAIAKAHGGGGHKGAAGFVCHELPWQRIDGTASL
jgi:oligoribonuclease NrnB/cAMP/cGMP phosphodiesterase (DHH superfamily)